MTLGPAAPTITGAARQDDARAAPPGLLAAAHAAEGDLPTDRPALAPTTTAVSWTGQLNGQAPCPEGMTRQDRLAEHSLDGGVPNQQFNDGWESVAGLGSGKAARASVSSGDVGDHFFLSYARGTVGRRTMLGLATKGTQADSAYTRAQVNSVDLLVSAPTSWAGRVYDVTAATDDEGGWLGTWLEHRSRSGAATTWHVDNIQLYT